MSDAAPSQRTYRYPRGARLSWAAAALVSTALAALGLYLQLAGDVDLFERGQLLIFTAAFAALALHASSALLILRTPVTLDTTGLRVGAELVPWSRVTELEIRPLAGVMHVHDDAGRRLLTVRSDLEVFGAVQEYIIEHMNPRPCAPPCEVPLLTPFLAGPLVLALALIAVWFGPRQSGVPALLFAGLALGLLLLYAVRRRSLRLERDRLVLRQGWRSFALPYREITAVQLHTEPRGHGALVRSVRLQLGAAEPIDIGGFRGGYQAAFRSIGRAWSEGRQG